jgi:hypothetical protein
MSQADLHADEPARHSRSRERVAATSLEATRERAVRLVRRGKTRARLIRDLVPPLVLGLIPLYWVADATYRASLTTIGRDQGIFHYIAWAVSRGDVDYRDIRDVNGPLVHLIHLVMLKLGAGDEHRFHVLDLVATGASFAIVGAILPSIMRKGRPSLGWLERLAWAFAAWVTLMGQYALYLYWNQAQRESFCDWFLLPSIALQMTGLRDGARAAPLGAPRVFRRVVAIFALSTICWFGKPSFVLFTVMQLGVLLFDRDNPLSARTRLKASIIGGALGAVVPVLFLLRYGDIAAFLQITLRDVPQIYRFIWARSAPEILGDEGPLGVATMGLAVSATLTALVVARELPRRLLVLALAPTCGLVAAIAQHKGFGYHFHPLTATTHIGLMVIVVYLWGRFRTEPRKRPLGRLLALGATVAYALVIASNMRLSPHTRAVWILAGGETEERRNEEEYFDQFKSHDFFPWDMRQGAWYLSTVTSPDARVQVYGMDPYILFLAQRRSATPYIYAYDLNADAALDGGWSNRPTWLEAEHIRAVRAAHERDLLVRLKKAPPEAFAFIDHAPLMSYFEAWEDLRHCCSETATWVAEHYHPARSFGEVHVWLRDDMPVPDAETWP